MTDIVKQEITQTVKAAINARRYFQQMGQSFQTSFSILGELMQNARRAGATSVEFVANYEDRTLEVIDDGCGIEDFQNLIELCTSGWDSEDIQLVDKPFGMGLFSLFYACDKVTIRSRGQVLNLCLDDIVNERALHVMRDESPQEKGTRILLTGLNSKLMINESSYIAGAKPKWKLLEELRIYAEGFGIPVILNAEALPQPYARRNIGGQITSIGWVCVQGVHGNADMQINLEKGGTHFYLQGLPIERNGSYRHANVVHLDSEQFLPLMPDRARLQDASTQLDKVYAVVKSIARDFVTAQKDEMEPGEFLNRYFEMLPILGLSNLLNVIGFLPASLFQHVNEVSFRSAEVWEAGWSARDNFVSRREILDGAVKVWRNAPGNTEYGQWAATLLKVMQREEILRVKTDRLDAGHWIFDCVPDMNEFDVAVVPENCQGSISVESGNWDSCQLTLVDSVAIHVTSRVNPAFKLDHNLTNDWLVVPVSPVLDPDDDHDFTGATICYITANDKSNDHPCGVFQSFENEWDVYEEDWFYDAAATWNSIVNGLLGKPAARTLQIALNEACQAVTPNQAAHIAAVRVVRHWNEYLPDVTKMRHSFDVVDLNGPEFWKAMAANLNRNAASEEDLGLRLMRAFKDVINPNEVIVPGGERKSLLCAAGYSIRGSGEEIFVLPPGECVPEVVDEVRNFVGYFSSVDAAVEEVSRLVIQDTLTFHMSSSEAFADLPFTEKWQLVKAAHAQRIAAAVSRIDAQRIAGKIAV